jgi:hypothetical protein
MDHVYAEVTKAVAAGGKTVPARIVQVRAQALAGRRPTAEIR